MTDSNLFSLQGKVVLQVGGTGLLGRALASALTTAGGTLVVASRNRHSLVAFADAECSAGRRFSIEETDIRSETSLSELRDRILGKYGGIDGVVFNAVSRPMLAMDDNIGLWRESMEVNSTGLFATMRIFGDAMAARRKGSIVNISSIYGMVGMNPWLYEGTAMTSPPDYYFHKGGMVNLTRYLASHYGPSGVRVNVISPGGIFDPGKPAPPEFVGRYGRMTMLGRMANAAEVGGAVVFLLSDASSYITGVNLPVDGGLTAK